MFTLDIIRAFLDAHQNLDIFFSSSKSHTNKYGSLPLTSACWLGDTEIFLSVISHLFRLDITAGSHMFANIHIGVFTILQIVETRGKFEQFVAIQTPTANPPSDIRSILGERELGAVGQRSDPFAR
eukprot:GABV01009011.1.p2 GENE.GABV01009011.1~~GABV01009011.1.p2  ORF type:complete len:126 (-),score=25.92 GABV01009011.1:374-751(-)